MSENPVDRFGELMRKAGREDLLAANQESLRQWRKWLDEPATIGPPIYLFASGNITETIEGGSTTIVKTVTSLVEDVLEPGDIVMVAGKGRRRIHDLAFSRGGNFVWVIMDNID